MKLIKFFNYECVSCETISKQMIIGKVHPRIRRVCFNPDCTYPEVHNHTLVIDDENIR